MTHRLAALGLCLLFLSAAQGCSEARPDPCSLYSIHEAQGFDGSISISRAFPPKGEDKNDVCLYYNANGEPRLMLFVWSDYKIDPFEAVQSGMRDSDSRIVEITGVGARAAAGFKDGELKLFAAGNENGTIGVRVRDPIAEGDARLDDVKILVAKVLGRLQ